MVVPRLSIVTRTRNRPAFLRRAAASVATAAPTSFEWIIVNDGGDAAPIDALVKELSPSFPGTILVVSIPHGGRGAAANAGLEAISGEFFHLHDDDDSVDAEFYRRMTGWLDANPEAGAAACRTRRIEERLDGTRIETVRASSLTPGLETVTFAGLARAFLFPPIAFLARKSSCDAVGLFDTDVRLPEDYDYAIRFLEKFDIGVVPEELANVHQRINATDAAANSPGTVDFLQFNAVLRNRYFRRDLASGKAGLGWLMVLGELAEPGRKFERLLATLETHRATRWLFSRLRP